MSQNRFVRWAVSLVMTLTLALSLGFGAFVTPVQAGTDAYLGEVDLYAITFCPTGTLEANGQILSIAQYTALFSLLGCTYGGNCQSTFALPDLRGRVPLSQGQGPGLSNYALGQRGGVEQVTLSVSEIPSHSHAVVPSTVVASVGSTTGNFEGGGTAAVTSVTPTSQTPGTGLTGGNQPHENRQPYLALRYCIATQGVYPSRS